jgi:hypothetical protein
MSRSWIAHNEAIVWWASGLAQRTQASARIIDPTGQSTQIGSSSIDNLCEASGVFSAEQRPAGVYTLIVTGTRNAGGGSVDLTMTFRIISATMPSANAGGTVPVPLAPTNVRATIVGGSALRVTWEDRSDNETGFRINGEIGSGTVGPNVTSFSASGLTPGRIYCYSVSAYNAAGESYGGTSCNVAGGIPGTGQ